jgi:hypothetical protein
MSWESTSRIFLVPVIAIFTKYDQFRRNIVMKLEDQGRDTSQELLNAEVEKVFNEQYLASLGESAPFVRLESENFVNQLAYTTLIPVPQKCTGPANGAPRSLKRLPMNSPEVSLPSCSWLSEG